MLGVRFLRGAEPVSVALGELFDSCLELLLRARFELSGSFARHSEAPADLGQAELVLAVGHQPLFRDVALAFVESGNRAFHRVADAAVELGRRKYRLLIDAAGDEQVAECSVRAIERLRVERNVARLEPPEHALYRFFGEAERLGEQRIRFGAVADLVGDANALAAELEEHLGAQCARTATDETPRTDHVIQDVRANPVRGVRDETRSAILVELS